MWPQFQDQGLNPALAGKFLTAGPSRKSQEPHGPSLSLFVILLLQGLDKKDQQISVVWPSESLFLIHVTIHCGFEYLHMYRIRGGDEEVGLDSIEEKLWVEVYFSGRLKVHWPQLAVGNTLESDFLGQRVFAVIEDM